MEREWHKWFGAAAYMYWRLKHQSRMVWLSDYGWREQWKGARYRCPYSSFFNKYGIKERNSV